MKRAVAGISFTGGGFNAKKTFSIEGQIEGIVGLLKSSLLKDSVGFIVLYSGPNSTNYRCHICTAEGKFVHSVIIGPTKQHLREGFTHRNITLVSGNIHV